uniref:Global nitrogen transcriptional regulator n=1 Tax=Lophurella stichidiosa TaxID=2008659 RepID=UPI002551DBF6|nr:Global nitrogen transcriptional regulator [Aphanocladia stichidiosa]WGH13966.1 Global nitrogen transcriptional regulator [Aphanocladia stichidiosa]
MKWIKFLTNNKIPYYIYKLKKEDFIILNNIKNKNKNIIIILSGTIFITKVFPNKESLPIAILNKNNILIKNNKELRIYYKIIALEKTYILTLDLFILKQNKVHTLFRMNILNAYKKTIEQYEVINNIMSQKNIKNRILQLIFNICLRFGQIKNQQIFIPFQLSNKNIAILTGTSTNTVSKIMKKIYNKNIIKNLNKKVIFLDNIFNLDLK